MDENKNKKGYIRKLEICPGDRDAQPKSHIPTKPKMKYFDE